MDRNEKKCRQTHNHSWELVDRISNQKINSNIKDVNYTIYQIDLIVTYKVLHLASSEYTVFPSVEIILQSIPYTKPHKKCQ